MDASLPTTIPSEINIRLFTSVDLPLAMELKDIAGWNQIAADWLGYLEFEPGGCFVAEADGRAAGTATAIRYESRVAWIGMVLVHPRFRRLGIGTQLLRHSIAYLQQRGIGSIKLDATPMGRRVYLPLGFKDEYEVTRFEVVARTFPGDETASESLQTDHLTEVGAFDRPFFGADREVVLRTLQGRNPELCFVRRGPRGVLGFLIAREGQNAVQIGPWLAHDVDVAEQLLRALLAKLAGRKVFVDVPHVNPGGLSLVNRYGFAVQRGFTRMYLGDNAHPGLPGNVFGSGGAEKG